MVGHSYDAQIDPTGRYLANWPETALEEIAPMELQVEGSTAKPPSPRQ